MGNYFAKNTDIFEGLTRCIILLQVDSSKDTLYLFSVTCFAEFEFWLVTNLYFSVVTNAMEIEII